jgi:hypothetical protein
VNLLFNLPIISLFEIIYQLIADFAFRCKGLVQEGTLRAMTLSLGSEHEDANDETEQ